jgi:hypothetical protein
MYHEAEHKNANAKITFWVFEEFDYDCLAAHFSAMLDREISVNTIQEALQGSHTYWEATTRREESLVRRIRSYLIKDDFRITRCAETITVEWEED